MYYITFASNLAILVLILQNSCVKFLSSEHDSIPFFGLKVGNATLSPFSGLGGGGGLFLASHGFNL